MSEDGTHTNEQEVVVWVLAVSDGSQGKTLPLRIDELLVGIAAVV
jgi:hypothetical protein